MYEKNSAKDLHPMVVHKMIAAHVAARTKLLAAERKDRETPTSAPEVTRFANTRRIREAKWETESWDRVLKGLGVPS